MTEIPAEKTWRRIALPASIILNLFLIALIVGHLWYGPGRFNFAGERGMPLARALARAEALLPPKDAAAFGAVIRRDEPQLEKSIAELRSARLELDRQIVADPFDPQATRKALLATETAWDHFVDDFSGTLVDALAQVSPDGRRKLISVTHFGPRAVPR